MKMMVNYSNYIFIVLSVIGYVYGAPVEEERVGEQERPPQAEPYEEVPTYPQRPTYGLNLRSNIPSPYGLPPGRDAESGIIYLVDLARPRERNPTETNEINSGDDGLVSIMLHQADGSYRNYYSEGDRGDRKKREAGPQPESEEESKLDDSPESSGVGKLRKKRTFCKRCGGYGGGYRPVYPVYGGGCNYCGGGRPYYGGGGGGGGSYSQSSAQSSSSSWGYGKK